jgi:16S rRNA (guanine527-N7)-methyltransferase
MTSLASALASLHLVPSVEEKLNKFTDLFVKWNRNINLSAARSEADLQDHIIDCLHVVPHLRSAGAGPSTTNRRILDVGAGGGLPAVIAAICLPDVSVTALEPVHKKHAFLRAAARELSLANLAPLAERLDDHRSNDYDAAMSRATFDLCEWLALGLSHVRTGGLVLGFEAVPRTDLPHGAQRHSYSFADKSRAIVTVLRSADAT